MIWIDNAKDICDIIVLHFLVIEGLWVQSFISQLYKILLLSLYFKI